MERFNARMRLPIIVSAILPLIIVSETSGWVSDTVEIVTWLVFLADYVVHVRYLEHYGRTGYGRFDLFVVVVTAPWFLIPGAQAGGFVVVFRLARLARLVLASRGARRLFDRLGRVAVVATGVVILGSLVAYYSEHSVNPEFATFGDALWWGIVTLTTVGYGDIVPKTPTGRWAAVVIMVTGIAVLGVLAGALSSFFRLGEKQADDGPAASEAANAPATPADAAITALAAEVAGLRRQVEALTRLLTGTSAGQPPEEPPDEGRLDLFQVGEGHVDLHALRELGDQGVPVDGRQLVVAGAPVEPVLLDGIDVGAIHHDDQVNGDALGSVLGPFVVEIHVIVRRRDLDRHQRVIRPEQGTWLEAPQDHDIGPPERELLARADDMGVPVAIPHVGVLKHIDAGGSRPGREEGHGEIARNPLVTRARRLAEYNPAVHDFDALADLRGERLVLLLGDEEARGIRRPDGKGHSQRPPPVEADSVQLTVARRRGGGGRSRRGAGRRRTRRPGRRSPARG
jgi:voltage-gated potassium channel